MPQQPYLIMGRTSQNYSEGEMRPDTQRQTVLWSVVSAMDTVNYNVTSLDSNNYHYRYFCLHFIVERTDAQGGEVK